MESKCKAILKLRERGQMPQLGKLFNAPGAPRVHTLLLIIVCYALTQHKIMDPTFSSNHNTLEHHMAMLQEHPITTPQLGVKPPRARERNQPLLQS